MRLGRRKFVNLTSGSLGSAVLLGCGQSDPQGSDPMGTGDGSTGSSSSGAPGGSTGDDTMPDGSGGASTGGSGEEPEPVDIPDLPGGTPASVGTSSREELEFDLSVLAGKVPTDMLGHYFMVCPMPWRDGTMLVNGDGMVFRLDFGDDAVHLRSRLVKTPCYYAEKGVAGTDDAFNNPGGGPARLSSTLGARNQCNTALVPLSTDRILATFDGGRPFELDPVTLEVVTPMGYHREWKPGLDFSSIPGNIIGSVFPLVFSTAHPSFDTTTGEVFSLNYGNGAGIEILGNQLIGEIFTRVIRWDGHGELQHWNLVDESGDPMRILQSAHQMQVTERYVIIQDSAFRIEPGQLFDPNAFEAQLQQTVLWIIRRSDLDAASPGSDVLARRFTIPRESPHFLADYENPGGRLTIHVVHNVAYDASEWLKDGDRLYSGGGPVRTDLLGMLNTTTDLNHIGRYVIDVEGRGVIPGEVRLMKDDDLTWAITLFTHRGTWAPGKFETHFWVSTGFEADILTDKVAQAYADHPHREMPLASLPLDEGRPCALFRCNPDEGQIVDGYPFPRGRFVSSPQFVPRTTGDGPVDGYVVCTVISDDKDTAGSSGDEFWIFDARELSRGPICRLGHPKINLPYTLHTTWLPEIAPRSAEYRVDVVEDHAEEVAKLDEPLQHMFAQQVYPPFLL